VSIQDRPIAQSERNELQVIGRVQSEFTSFQFLHIQNKRNIRRKAYSQLLESARKQYGNNVDVRNIRLNGRFSGYHILNAGAALAIGIPLGGSISGGNSDRNYHNNSGQDGMNVAGTVGGIVIGTLLAGNTQKIIATGDVISLNRAILEEKTPSQISGVSGMEGAVNRASVSMINKIPANLTVTVVNVSSNDEMADFATNEIKFRLAESQKFRVLDEKAFDNMRFRRGSASGEMTDSSAIALGQMLGANVVITVNITRTGLNQTLTVKALDSRTAQIMVMVRETI